MSGKKGDSPASERTEAALAALLSAKGYACVAPEAARRAVEEAFDRYKSPKEAQKAARRYLHGLVGAYAEDFSPAAISKCLAEYRAGDETALDRARALHASTRERPRARALFEAVLEKTGGAETVLDLACGLNPLTLGAMGLRVRGLEAHGGLAAGVNAWAASCGWDVRVETGDLLTPRTWPPCDLALYMKLLPLLERQQKGRGVALLRETGAPWHLVTFPTRTLGGRKVGMAENYAAWFEGVLPAHFQIVWTDEWDGELMYLLREDRNV